MKIWFNIHVIIYRLLEVYNPIFSGVSSTYYSVFNERGILKGTKYHLIMDIQYMDIKIHKLERILMLEGYFKSTSNFKDFFL